MQKFVENDLFSQESIIFVARPIIPEKFRNEKRKGPPEKGSGGMDDS
jgi:hypothetical protein